MYRQDSQIYTNAQTMYKQTKFCVPRYARRFKNPIKSTSQGWGGTRTHRNPTSTNLRLGWRLSRCAECRTSGRSSDDPPRTTRRLPELGPKGSTNTPDLDSLYQSRTHSQTLPCISYSPRGFGSFFLTSCACPE